MHLCLSRLALLMTGMVALPVAAQTVTDTNLVVETAFTGASLNQPTCMVFVSPTEMLVTEKATGRVRRVVNNVVQTTPAIDLPVNSASERGLLGIALDPQFSSNNLVYLYYTVAPADGTSAGDPVTANRVARFTYNSGTGLLTFQQTVIDLPVTSGPNHDGGIITFGPPTAAPADQKLFIVIGDLNRNGQNQNNTAGGAAAPDNTGMVLRLNPDGSIPSGADKGPFYNVAGSNASLQAMYAYGIRNSFGMEFDPVSGALWDTENGPSNNDEINRIDPGFNSGWDTVMGFQSGGTPAGLVQFSGVGTYSNPEFTWSDVVAPTAIHFYRDTALGAAYQHDCFVGANNNGKLYRFEPDGGRTGFTFTDPNLTDTVLNSSDSDATIVFGTNFGVIGDIDTGPDGNLYVSSIFRGLIYRIRPQATAVHGWELYD